MADKSYKKHILFASSPQIQQKEKKKNHKNTTKKNYR